MHKKNPFIFTIKFDPRDPQDCETVRILNEKGRGMAKFISEAIKVYQLQPSAWEKSEYKRMEKLVFTIINQYLENANAIVDRESNSLVYSGDQKKSVREELELSDNEFHDILNIIDVFREEV